MSSLITLNDTQKRVVAAVREHKDNPQASLRALSKKFNVPRTTLQRACNTDGSEEAILSMSEGRGRKQRLTAEEEQLIVDAALEFQTNGTPLCRDSLQDLAKTLIQTFPPERRIAFDFNDDRPGKRWITKLLQRFPTLSLKTRANLEHDRAAAMTPEIVATHFARIRALCVKHNIIHGAHIFNLDESGFSIRGMTLGVERVAL